MQIQHNSLTGNPFIKGGRGLNFRIFRKKGGSDFSHKKGGVGKIGEFVLKKSGGYHLFSY